MTFPGLIRTHGDRLIALVLTVSLQAELWASGAPLHDRVGASAAGLVLTAALMWRVRFPVSVLALVGAALLVAKLVFPTIGDPGSFGPILLLALYSAAAHTRGRRAAAAGAISLAAMLGAAVEDQDQINFGNLLFFAMLFAAPWAAGWAVRHRREREVELVAERDEKARTAVAEERARIARELHDVVAHAISVIVLQARGARHAEPAEREDALDAIESTGAKALAEMRRLLHILRADDEAVALAPQPSLDSLELLLSQVRDAGLPVELEIEGERRELPPGVDVSAYRIVQEALTNALKHAGPAQASVRVRYDADCLELEIADTGHGTANGGSSGHGVIGMRERVAVFGGELASGPRRGGGYSVRARLPL